MQQSAAIELHVKKRKQHYVWEHYLTAWANGSTLYCQQAGRHFPVSTDKIANERDFYRLNELSSDDLRYVSLLVEKLPYAESRAVAENWIKVFNEPFELNHRYLSGDLKSEAFEAAFDETVNNLEEDLHASFERDAIPFLADLKRCSAAQLFDNVHGVKAAMFIALQYLRTPKLRGKMAAINTDGLPGFKMETAWGLLRTIYSSTFGAGLYFRRSLMRVTFLHASSDRSFITGDQPIINVGDTKDEAKVQLYYPLSPRLAIIIGFDAKASTSSEVQLTLEETCSYNARIAASCDRQLYAASPDDFVDLRSTN